MKCCKCGQKVDEIWMFAQWVDVDELEYCKECFDKKYDEVMKDYNEEE